jgi:DNA-directed RNA polymerase specialized sigma24 family protein
MNMSNPVFTQRVDEHDASFDRLALRLSGREAEACDPVQLTFYIRVTKGETRREATKACLFTKLERGFLRGPAAGRAGDGDRGLAAG